MNKINLPFIATVLCFLFFSIPIATPDSYAVTPLLLATLSLFLLPKTYKALAKREVRLISLSMIGYFILTATSLLYYGGNISQLDMPSRTIFASFIILLLLTYKPNPKVIFLAAPIGAFIAGLIGLYHSFYLGNGGRAFFRDGYMVIQVGGMIASLATFSVISFFYYRKNEQQYLVSFSFIATSLGYIATLLSGARGAWLLTPFVLLVILYLNRELISKKIIAATGLTMIVVLSSAYPQISSRLNEIQYDLDHYDSNISSTSSGARLDMWKSALYSAKEKPIFGQGYNHGIEKEKLRQVEKGLVSPEVLKYSRAHNQYLEDLQTKGLLGLGVLLAMFTVPFLFFRKNMKLYTDKKEKNTHYFLALMGTTHVVLIAGYSLTQHYLAHHSGILFFTVGVAILSALVINQRDQL